MPTGYTCDIEKGISFKKYALDCARAFGALVEMRDDSKDTPIPERFEPSDYHTRRLKEAENRMEELSAMSDEKIQAEMKKENDKRTNELIASIKRKNDLRDKYNKILNQAESYISPSSDHDEYRKFMISQLTESIKYDCDTSYSTEELEKLPTDYNKWFANEIKDCKYRIDYHTKEHIKEVERVEGRNLWVKQLRKSLEKYED